MNDGVVPRLNKKDGERFVWLGVENMKNGADQQSVAGFLPVIAALERSLGVDKHVRRILNVAYLPFAAANFQQRIVGCRLRIGRIKQQHAAVPSPEARSQGPVLTLDVVDNATAWPGQQGRYHETNTLSGRGRRKAQHMLRSIMAQVIALEPSEHDAIGRGKASSPNF